MTEPFAGDRVVVRYRLGAATPSDWRPAANPATHGPSLSDVTGILVDDGDPLVIERDGVAESIPRAEITSIRVLSRVTVRNKEIRNLEVAAADAWPGTETARFDGWLLRAGGGFTRRANSALPVEFGAAAGGSTMRAIRDWYAARDLPAVIAAPERLLPGGQIDGRLLGGEVQVLAADLDALDVASRSGDVHIDDTPTASWLRAYRGPDVDVETAGAVVGSSRGPLVIASVVDDGRPVATGRASVTAAPDGTRWLGITAVWADPDRRRQGHASAVLSSLGRWGVEEGAQRGYVQVETENRVAGSWYRRVGFGLHHSYRYVEI
ncbi:GNAT family N-acetyltransferase [Gordonia sp. CPCC 205515]|uniref:N-acetylglutamate synthase, CG3035 family n=1 Tax=Gordonia sp. CPCC 205515 TaxID=3140791 RepID=UPI003AF3CD94